ncbi:N-fatty-acyl-amino acid synthase/hydrolase PM20D1-like [Limulus polyphemus]|uniref:N-fatty-acyl-amino acid synthase/hydrolase PM20D1-like n=1 Tax=Limulus polyphemus TaxID=6850 RepID=A0ABM1BCV4_LIMPO|nr:N-fatty-acyl-amino acid synthase/hydrolase PM20D1-like [Limulus polyphemus]
MHLRARAAGLTLVLVCLISLGTIILRAVLIEKPRAPSKCTSTDNDFISETRGLSLRLAEAIRFRTISWAVQKYEREELKKFGEFIRKSFPLIHSAPYVNREVINELSLLYTVKGTDSSLKPYLLAGHLDVVPVDSNLWEVPPFDGRVVNKTYVYGRGTIDAKHIVMGILEALEFLLEKGYQPKRSFYIAFGHDEEVTGVDGAAQISKVLQERGVQLEYILDEGMMVLNGTIPGVDVPVATVGVTEKGSLSVKLTVNGTPGHSSFPPPETAIVVLAKALSKLEGSCHPSMFGKGPERTMLEALAPYASFPFKVVYSNIWFFSPLLSWFLSLKPHSNALLRTTTSVTMVSGGVKLNVIPTSASAVVNHRIHPAQTVAEVLEYDQNLIDDQRVEIEVLDATEPHPVSPHGDDVFGFQTLRKSIYQIFPGSAVAPTMLIANTDTRWYLSLSKVIYRFSPINILPKDLSLIHGNNERISINNYEQVVNFYYHMMINSDEEKLEDKHEHGDEL